MISLSEPTTPHSASDDSACIAVPFELGPRSRPMTGRNQQHQTKSIGDSRRIRCKPSIAAFRCLSPSLLAVSACRTERPNCVSEESWLIVIPTSKDEASEQARTGERGEDGPGYSQSRSPAKILRNQCLARCDQTGQTTFLSNRRRGRINMALFLIVNLWLSATCRQGTILNSLQPRFPR